MFALLCAWQLQGISVYGADQGTEKDTNRVVKGGLGFLVPNAVTNLLTSTVEM